MARSYTLGDTKRTRVSTQDGAAHAASVPATVTAAFAVALAAVLSASCATPVHFPADASPASLLSPDAVVAIECGREGLALVAPALFSRAGEGSSAARRQAEAMVERTRKAAFAVYGDGAELVLAGDYPWRAAALAFGQDSSWTKRRLRLPGGTANLEAWKGAGIELALPGPGLALLSTRGVDRLVAALPYPLQTLTIAPTALESALAAARAEAGEEAIAIVAPEPFARLGTALLGQAIDLPCRLLVLALAPGGTEEKDGERVWTASIRFVMESPEDARLYRPAARTAWFLVGRALFPGTGTSLGFSVSGDAICATGFAIPESSLRKAVAAFAAMVPGADGIQDVDPAAP